MAPRVDLAGLAGLDDPYPVYADMRAQAPLWRCGPGQWVVGRYGDVAALLRDPRPLQFQFAAAVDLMPEAVAARLAGAEPAVDFTRRILAGRDREDHAALRRVMAAAMRPALDGVPSLVADVLPSLIAPLADGERVDAVADLARPLVVDVVAGMIGLPEDGRREAADHADALALIFSPTLDGDVWRRASAAVEWLRCYVGDVVERRRREPAGDVVSRMVHSADGRRDLGLAPVDVVDNVVLLLFAGLETSVNLIANGCAVLAAHPSAHAQIRRDPGLVPAAVEELLRYDAPLHLTGRYLADDVCVAGHPLRRGRVVLLLLASANRDPAQFAAPDRFDVTRHPNPHLGFGAGPHTCLGATVARRIAHSTFAGLLGAFSALDVGARVPRSHDAPLHTVGRLDLAAAR